MMTPDGWWLQCRHVWAASRLLGFRILCPAVLRCRWCAWRGWKRRSRQFAELFQDLAAGAGQYETSARLATPLWPLTLSLLFA